MNKRTTLLILLASTLLIGCSDLKEPEFRRIDNVRLPRFGMKESIMTVEMTYYNPNKARLTLKRASGEAWLDDEFIGNFTVDTTVRIPPLSDFQLPIKLHVDMAQILKKSKTIMEKKEVEIKLKGKARVAKGALAGNYKIKYEGKHNLAEFIKSGR
jgi:LEA14-like dessication related protein